MQTSPKSLALVAVGLLAPAIAARAARSAAGVGYQAITRHDPPKNPAHPQVDWKEAIVWTVASGIVGGLARLATRRWLVETIVPSEGYDMEEELEG